MNTTAEPTETTNELEVEAHVSDVAPCRKKLEITVKAKSVDSLFDEAYKNLDENVQVRGFRRGHAPRRLLERKFAKDVTKDGRGRLFQDALRKGMDDNNLSPLGAPDADVETLEVKPGTDFSFSTEIDVRPEFDLPEYEELELEEKVEPVTDEQVNNRLSELQRNFAKHEKTDDPSAEHDLLVADTTLKAGDEEIFSDRDTTIPVEGERIFGIECKGLVEKLSGLKAGQEITLDIKFPEDYHREDLSGKSGTVLLSIHGVERENLPELDDAFAKRVGLDSMEVLRKMIKGNMEDQNKQKARNQLESDIMDMLIAKTSFDLPQELLKRQAEAVMERRKIHLARQGATDEVIEEKMAELKDSSAKDAEHSLRWMIISDTIAEKEELEVTPQDIQQSIEALARVYRVTPAQMLERVQRLGGLESMAMEIRDTKVIRMLMDKAKITTTTISGEDTGNDKPADKQEE